MNSLLLLLSSLIPATAQTAPRVVAPVDVLLGRDPEPDASPDLPWIPARSELTVTPLPDELVHVRVDVEVVALEPGWVSLPVLDGRVRLEDTARLHMGPDRNWWFTGWVESTLELTAAGTMTTTGAQADVFVARAVRMQVRGVGEGLAFDVVGAVDGALPPTDRAAVSWRPDVDSPVVQQDVVQADVATAAWLDEGTLRVRSKVRWTVRRGEQSRFVLQLGGAANELEVQGVGLGDFQRSGSTVTVTPLEPVDGVFEVTLDWVEPMPKGKASVAQPDPRGVVSTNWSLTLAGDSETLLSPATSGSLRAVALQELEPDARALGDAQPVAAWTGRGTLQLSALELQSLDGPTLVVDVARCTAAQAVSGRTLMTCSLDVRNASEQYLAMRPPEGMSLWSARVNGDGVAPVDPGDGRVLLPLERSVETLVGLTALTVELTFLSEGDAFERKGARSLSLPAFDAPVARVIWEVRLPPGYRGEVEGGSARVAGEVHTELVYDSRAEADKVAARETWNYALRAYQDNDFEAAQEYVDQTLALDSSNDNAVMLQSNLDVLEGKDVSGSDEAMERRVKEMAKAKVADEVVLQEEKLAEAERMLNMGDYEGAIAAYEEVEALADELEVYEQDEEQGQAYYRSSSSSGATEARKRSNQGRLGRDRNRDEAESDRAQYPDDNDDLDQVVVDGWGEVELEDDGRWVYKEIDPTDLAGGEETFYWHDAGDGDGTPDTGLVTEFGEDGQGLYDHKDDVAQRDFETTVEFAELEISGELVRPDGAVMPVEEPVYVPEPDAVDMPVPMDPEPEPVTVTVTSQDASRATGVLPGVANGRGSGGLGSRGSGLGGRGTKGEAAAAPAGGPAPMGGSNGQAQILGNQPALAATTLAIPLPDHGESIVVVESLLAAGEASTLTVTYRENR